MRRSVAIGGALVAALAIAPAASAAPSGGVLGWVEDSHGLPVAGAVVSLFGRGAGSSGLVTLTDSAGRFFVPSLPAGSYTLRALRTGHVPAPARKVVVLPDQDATFTVSLTPLAEAAARGAEAKASEEAARETEWLLRHKRRSVLEARGPSAEGLDDANSPDSDLLASFLADLDGTVEVMASAASVGVGPVGTSEPGSSSLVQLSGRLADSGRWRVGGLLAERESTTWRMAAEFVVEPMEGHEFRAATGYGSRYLRPQISGEAIHDRGVGGVALEDRWTIGESVTATLGGRFSYVGFMSAPNYFDPSATVAYAYSDRTAFRGSYAARTVAPGGDMLTISSLASAPAMSFAVLDDALRAERFVRYELGMDQQLGSTSVGAFTYYENVRDRLVNVFEGASESRSLRIGNAGGAAARGLGVTVGRCFGDAVRGSMSYTYGRTQREDSGPVTHGDVIAVAHPEGGFHDFAARVETVIEGTDTRLVAYYRLNRLNPGIEGESTPAPAALTNTRFDVQLSQGLPFLGSLTRADWDFLVAVRNLFYETSEGALLDEVVVTNPPKRVLGGISVRF